MSNVNVSSEELTGSSDDENPNSEQREENSRKNCSAFGDVFEPSSHRLVKVNISPVF